jgi:hypothetical protein
MQQRFGKKSPVAFAHHRPWCRVVGSNASPVSEQLSTGETNYEENTDSDVYRDSHRRNRRLRVLPILLPGIAAALSSTGNGLRRLPSGERLCAVRPVRHGRPGDHPAGTGSVRPCTNPIGVGKISSVPATVERLESLPAERVVSRP